MSKFFLAIACFAYVFGPAATPASAQATTPEAEIFGGITKLWGHANGGRFDEGGGQASVTGYLNRAIGLEADFDVFTSEPPNAPAYGNHFSFLFGPHFAYHSNPRISPFSHVLLGVTRGSSDGPSFTVVTRSAFTLAIGGGVDVKIWRFLWLRPVQIDYLRESFSSVPYPPEPFPRALENNLRLAAGLVVRFGR